MEASISEHPKEYPDMTSSDEDSQGEHTFRYDARNAGSLFTGISCSIPYYRMVILCLGLLNSILLLAAIVIGVYCGTVSGTPQQSHGSELFTELKQLQSMQSEAIKAKEEAQKAFEKEASSHLQQKLQLDVQNALNDDLQRQIESLRAQKAMLLSNSSDIRVNCGRCPPGWALLRTSCYFHASSQSFSKKNWSDSRADCIRRGADLVVIDNWAEQVALFEHLPKASVSTQPWWTLKEGIWIGLTDVHTEGTWVWVNNVTQVDPGFWIDGEPNNHGLSGENCAAIFNKGNPRKTWFDGKCNTDTYEWLCEKKPN